MLNWGTFDDFSDDQESTENKPTEQKFQLDEVMPIIVKNPNIASLTELKGIYEPNNEFQIDDSNYYGQSIDFWSDLIQKNSPDIDVHIKFSFDTSLEFDEEIEPTKLKDPEKDPSSVDQPVSLSMDPPISSPKKARLKPPKGRPGYGQGKEHKKLQKDPCSSKSINNCYLFKNLRNPTHENVKFLGQWYNDDFSDYFTKGSDFPKFSRNQKRKKNLSFWFFENLILDLKTNPIIIPWLEIKISKLNSIN